MVDRRSFFRCVAGAAAALIAVPSALLAKAAAPLVDRHGRGYFHPDVIPRRRHYVGEYVEKVPWKSHKVVFCSTPRGGGLAAKIERLRDMALEEQGRLMETTYWGTE